MGLLDKEWKNTASAKVEVEAYLMCSRNSKETSSCGWNRGARVRVGEDRKRNRGNSCIVAYKAQKALTGSGNY